MNCNMSEEGEVGNNEAKEAENVSFRGDQMSMICENEISLLSIH